jgi:hypothetical protein
VAARKHRGAADPDDEAEFREALTSAIPLLIKRIENKEEDEDLRLEAIEVIGKLVNHGERHLETIAAQLIRTTKSNFVKLSRAGFHRSSRGLEMRKRKRIFDLKLLASW